MIYKKITLLFLIACLSLKTAYTQTSYTYTGKPQYQILTKRDGNFLGIINIELFPAIAPNHVRNFDSLVSKQFYDTTAFYRVIPGFMIEGGDPNSRHGPKSTWGKGDTSQPTVNAEFSPALHVRSILSAGRDTNINSANSQFFICVATATWLNNQYSIYGHVTSGMYIVDTIVNSPRDVNDCPIQKIEMFVTYTGSNDSVPEAPVLNTPANGTQNIGTNKLLKWNKMSDAIIYHVEVSTDSSFSSVFLTSKDVGSNSNFISGLTGSTMYYWRVKANNGGHWGAYSPVWHFSTTGYIGIPDLSFSEKGYRLDQNTPNPVNEQTMIKYATPGKERVVIKLFDMEGKELAVLVNEQKTKGEYQLNIDLSKYAAGIYFYQMQVEKMSETKKIIIER